MNTLAHLHLAWPEPGLLAGALLGDHIKGPLKGRLAPDWERGIALHRRIDAVTDAHPETLRLLEAMPAQYRRWGGIVLDVSMDHCLARHWQQYHSTALEPFCDDALAQLEALADRFPDGARHQLQRLRYYQVLPGLKHRATVERMLAGIGDRLRHDNPLAQAGAELADMQDAIDDAFHRLYPELLELQKEFLR